MAIVAEPASKLFDEISKLCETMTTTLGSYCQSKILQDYCLGLARSLLYGNMIRNFFQNLDTATQQLRIPQERTEILRRELGEIEKEVEEMLTGKHRRIDEQYYNNFKDILSKQFPEFRDVALEVEHISDFDRIHEYLKKREVDIRNSGQPRKELGLVLLTKATEKYVEKEKSFPIGDNARDALKEIFRGLFDEVADDIGNILREHTEETLQSWKSLQTGFESRLYQRWQLPIDLLHSMIILSLEIGERKTNLLTRSMDASNKAKSSAIIRIHAKCIQISREILTLVQSGYADGAFARWRTLHELSIISLFLSEQGEEVSKRYLNHHIMKTYKEAIDFQKYNNMLGEMPIEDKVLDGIMKRHDELIQTYGKEYEYSNGFEWIPTSILKVRTFKNLEGIVNMEKYRPYYSMSSNAVHGGAKGLLYGLGLVKIHRNSVLLAGPSNYGLADPLQNTAISLSFAALSLMIIEPRQDFESLLALQIITKYYVKVIGSEAVQVQRQIEEEEQTKTFNNQS